MSIPNKFRPVCGDSSAPFVCPVMTSQTTWRTTPPPSCGVVGFSATESHPGLPKPSEWKSLSGLYFAENQKMPERDTYVSFESPSCFWEVEFEKNISFAFAEFAICTVHDRFINTAMAEVFIDGKSIASIAFEQTSDGRATYKAFVHTFSLGNAKGKKITLKVTAQNKDYIHVNVNKITGRI